MICRWWLFALLLVFTFGALLVSVGAQSGYYLTLQFEDLEEHSGFHVACYLVAVISQLCLVYYHFCEPPCLVRWLPKSTELFGTIDLDGIQVPTLDVLNGVRSFVVALVMTAMCFTWVLFFFVSPSLSLRETFLSIVLSCMNVVQVVLCSIKLRRLAFEQWRWLSARVTMENLASA